MYKTNSTRYRMPAEWEPHKATWLTWPHNPADWPGRMSSVQKTYAELTQKLAAVEEVRILVNSERDEMRARRYIKEARADLANIRFYHIPTNRSWIRDYGPVFVADNRTKRDINKIMRFRFNGWARYPAHQKDDTVPLELASRLNHKMIPVKWKEKPLVLEGG